MRSGHMTATLTRRLILTTAAGLLSLGATYSHANPIDEQPSALAMTTDAIFVRPVLFATTLVGGAVYLVSLPFSLAGGNAEEAGEVLVAGPARATFVRCLGCTLSGRKTSSIVEQQAN